MEEGSLSGAKDNESLKSIQGLRCAGQGRGGWGQENLGGSS